MPGTATVYHGAVSGRRTDPQGRRSAPFRGLERQLPPWLLGAVLIAAPLLLGGVYPWGMVALAAGALCALASTLHALRPRALPAPAVVAGLLLGLLWTGLQTLPLPCGWIAALLPAAAENLRLTHALLELEPPTLCRASLDPAATREELIKGIAIVATFVSAALLIGRGGRRTVLWLVALSTVALGATAALHALVGAERVYGVYAPVDVRGFHFVAPIVNPNTLGGVMALGTPLLLGLATSTERRWLRALAIAAAALLVTIALLTRSRGAVGALLVGGLAYGALELHRLRTRRGPRTSREGPLVNRALRRYGAALVTTFALALAVYGAYEPVAREFEKGGIDKLRLIVRSGSAAVDGPLMGVGRGAFASAFVASSSARTRYEHAENVLVQWAVEWGIPVAIAIAALLGAALLAALRRARSASRAGALAGLLALIAQNMLDLGLELLGVALLASVLLAGVVVSQRSRPRGSARLARALPLGTAVAGALLLALAPASLTDHRPYQQAALRAALEAGDHVRVGELAVPALLAHPGEPTLVLYAANAALQRGDPRAGRWINRAMQLAPNWSGPHELAVHWLWRAGRTDQALLELREAVARDPNVTSQLLCKILRIKRDAVAKIVPRGPSRPVVLERSARCLGYESAEGIAIDAQLRRDHPELPGPRLRQARRLLSSGDAEAAFREAEAVMKAYPGHARALDLAVEALHAGGRDQELLKLLPIAIVAGGDAFRMRQLEARTHARVGDAAATRRVFAQLRALCGNAPARRLVVLRLEAQLLPDLGDPGRALQSLREAYGISSDIKDLKTMAIVAEAAGEPHHARWARRELCRRAPGGRPQCAVVGELPLGDKTLNTEGKRRD